MAKSIVTATLADVKLEPSEIPPDWILDGTPQTRNKMLLRTHDWIAYIVVWECTSGSYRWHYDQDEAIFVLSGEGFMTDDKGKVRRFGPGDMGFFPAGTTCTWRHPDHFRKVAVLKEPMWRPLGFSVKVWSKLLRVIGLKKTSPLMLVLAALISCQPR
jgi:uncharacterized cupin superfamily protein